ncbi:MAG TPA: choice-of-anchor D domain-containing protein [Candidatus Kapabacteria bacterium]|nr:choice-of-anchor D domain-containing protein [Candidatus Kapabacteria bacterium]
MQKFLSKSFLIIFILSLLSGFSYSLKAQDTEITEGREYWFGLPYCKMKQHENIRGDAPIVMWLSSKFDTKVKMTIPETGVIKNFKVDANKITQVVFDDQLMCRESEVVTNNGIHLLAEDPISVSIYYSYEWTGEAFRVIPIDWLGKKYVTLNMYLDQIDEMKPPQILIVAVEDNTEVTYIPTNNTEKVKAKQQKTVVLMKGQTYLILGEMNSAYVQDWASDITGTYITSSKPVAVFSGHTKGAFPRYYVGYKSGYTDPYALFARNMLMEQMWPIELLGKEYVTAPIKYLDRPRGLSGVADDFGDLVRFVATEDNTIIYQMRQDGSGMMQISNNLKRGEYWDITNQELAAYYKANKPVLVGHYGKTWWNEPGMMSVVGKGDDPQNPHKSGQGMLLTVAPIERWCSYANFKSPPAIDDFIYLTFRYADREKIYYDGEKITSLWGTAIRTITGTPYAYVATQIQPGDHYVEGKDGARWAAYAYGNWDRTKDGFAYGYPIGINYADICPDSIYVKDAMDCGNVSGEFFAKDLDPDTTCAAIFSINYKEKINYDIKVDKNFKIGDPSVKFTLAVLDNKQPASITVTAMTRSGKKLSKKYEYIPEVIEADPTSVDFGLIPLNQTGCKNVTLTNNSTVPVTIKELKLKNNRPEFKITSIDLPLTLQPNESKLIEVCATSLTLSSVPIRDSIIAVLSCYEQPIVELILRAGSPSLWIADANWGDIPINSAEKAQNVEMKNESLVDVEVYSITWVDHTHFTRVEGLNFPLTIPAGETYEFKVYFKTDVEGVPHRDSAYFESNAKETKLYSIWTGRGINAVPAITGFDWGKKRVIDSYAGVTRYPGTVTISNISTTSNLGVNDVKIVNDIDGVFQVDKSTMPPFLNIGESIDLNVYFIPNSEKEFQPEANAVNIVFESTFANQTRIAQDTLHGIGILPHILVTGIDYGKAILVDSYKDSVATIESVILNDLTAMDLTITDIKIEGTDRTAFVIEPTWYAGLDFPLTLAKGTSMEVPIRFTAQHFGLHNAQIVVYCDAAEDDITKLYNIGQLVGRGYTEGLIPTDFDYDKIFVYTTKTGSVSLLNTGSETIQVTKDIQNSKVGNPVDLSEFTITRWYTEQGGLENPPAPFDLAAGDRLIVEATFAPVEVRNEALHSIQIRYETNSGDTVSNLQGRAMLINTVAEIPKGYKANPGDRITIDFKYYKNDNESKPISQANITTFTARVYFNSENSQAYDIFPDLSNGCADIIKDGTMTASWTCNSAKIIDRKVLEVSMSGATPLTAGSGDVLFKFRMSTFLSSNDGNIKPIPCGFTRQHRYMEVDTIPGDISISPVCINTLRLIKLSGVDYSIAQNTPNPVANLTSIDYSIGLEANTTIKLYNANGEVVATFVDQLLQPGNYTLEIDVQQLDIPSGIYYYRLESGPYSETKSMVITK